MLANGGPGLGDGEGVVTGLGSNPDGGMGDAAGLAGAARANNSTSAINSNDPL